MPVVRLNPVTSSPRVSPRASPRQPLPRALRSVGIAVAVCVPLATLVGLLLGGIPAAWGALLGASIPVAFLSVTLGVAVLTARLSSSVMGVIVLGSWLVKLVIFGGVMMAVRAADFFSRTAFVTAFAVGLVGYLAVETVVILRTRELYVDPAVSQR